MRGIPYVVIAHDREVRLAGTNPWRWLKKAVVLRGAVGVLPVSQYPAGFLRRGGIPGDRMFMVHGGVNPAAFLASEDDLAQIRSRLSAASEIIEGIIR